MRCCAAPADNVPPFPPRTRPAPPAGGAIPAACAADSARGERSRIPPTPLARGTPAALHGRSRRRRAGRRSSRAQAAEGDGNSGPTRSRPYRPLRRSEFYSSGFLTENQKLPYGRGARRRDAAADQGHADQMPTRCPTPWSRSRRPEGRHLSGGRQPAGRCWSAGRSTRLRNVIVPTGILPGGGYGRWAIRRPASWRSTAHPRWPARAPAREVHEPGNARAVPVSDGVRGHVARWLRSPGSEGAADGGLPRQGSAGRRCSGRPVRDAPPARAARRRHVRVNEVMATLQIVHVRDHTATARVLNVVSPDIPAGHRSEAGGEAAAVTAGGRRRRQHGGSAVGPTACGRHFSFGSSASLDHLALSSLAAALLRDCRPPLRRPHPSLYCGLFSAAGTPFSCWRAA